MNKVSRTFGVGIVAASLTFAGATVAQATEAPYTLAAWVIPGGDSTKPFAEPQPFAMSMNTDVDSLEGLTLECGTTYQLDLYLNNEVTQKNVVPGALLNGPNNPFTEQWITGKWRGMGVDSAYVTTDACVVKPDPIEPTVKFGEWQEALIVCDAVEVATKREVFTTLYVYDEKSNSYVEGETVTTTEEGSRELTADEIEANKCVVIVPPVEPPVETPSELPTVPVTAELARTGTPPALPIGFASVFLAVGAFLIRKAARA